MALPTVSALNTIIDDLYSFFTQDKTIPGNRYAVGLIQKFRAQALKQYRVAGDDSTDIVITDNQDASLEQLLGPAVGAAGEDWDLIVTDAQDENLYSFYNLSETFAFDDDLTVTDVLESNLPAFFAGELATGLGQAPVVGDVFKVAGTGDTIDNDIEASKGSAPADEDFFLVTNVTAGSEEIIFLGNAETADGELAEDKSSVAAIVGDIFRVGGTGDTVGNDLEAAKGSAVADNDLFVVTGVSALNVAGNTVSFLGNAAVAAGELSEAPASPNVGGFGRAVRVGDRFQVGGTGDTLDNALQTSKGSAPADGDIFEITNITVGTRAIKFLGDVADITFADEEIADFVA